MGAIEIVHGDITKLAVDAIVTAANAALAGGGGVDGAIHRAAGPELLQACRELGRCETGRAVTTPAFALPATWVIHAVGPVWQGGRADEGALLESAYASAFAEAARHDVRTIAFPCISTGVYGFPKDLAAEIAVRVMERQAPGYERIIACTFGRDDEQRYRALLPTRGGRV